MKERMNERGNGIKERGKGRSRLSKGKEKRMGKTEGRK